MRREGARQGVAVLRFGGKATSTRRREICEGREELPCVQPRWCQRLEFGTYRPSDSTVLEDGHIEAVDPVVTSFSPDRRDCRGTLQCAQNFAHARSLCHHLAGLNGVELVNICGARRVGDGAAMRRVLTFFLSLSTAVSNHFHQTNHRLFIEHHWAAPGLIRGQCVLQFRH
ncbi:hypothetical protein ANRL2_01384 [Anaerolineae bacterium]|nr:hypothetical protein ANRL2_01384 [Anaerolineae bacterium]